MLLGEEREGFSMCLCRISTCGDGWQRQADPWALVCELVRRQASFGQD